MLILRFSSGKKCKNLEALEVSPFRSPSYYLHIMLV